MVKSNLFPRSDPAILSQLNPIQKKRLNKIQSF